MRRIPFYIQADGLGNLDRKYGATLPVGYKNFLNIFVCYQKRSVSVFCQNKH